MDAQLGRAVASGDDGLFDPEEDLVAIARLVGKVMIERDDFNVFRVSLEKIDHLMRPAAVGPAVRGGTFVIEKDSDFWH